jgi:hypothetical protein
MKIVPDVFALKALLGTDLLSRVTRRRGRMSNHQPLFPDLALPHRHRTQWTTGYGFAIYACSQIQNVSYGVSIPVQLRFDFAQGVVGEVKLLPVLQGSGAIISAGRRDQNKIRRQTRFQIAPVLRLYFVPEDAFERLSTGYIGPCRWLVFAPKRASRKD